MNFLTRNIDLSTTYLFHPLVWTHPHNDTETLISEDGLRTGTSARLSEVHSLLTILSIDYNGNKICTF